MDGQTGLFMAAPGQGRKAGHGGTAGLKQVGDNRQGRTKKQNCRPSHHDLGTCNYTDLLSLDPIQWKGKGSDP